jgi:hypothetical protein
VILKLPLGKVWIDDDCRSTLGVGGNNMQRARIGAVNKGEKVLMYQVRYNLSLPKWIIAFV